VTSEIRPKLVGASVKRLEDPRLLTGQGTFVDDLQPRRTAHVALRRSDRAHARIVSIDTRAARQAPGVVGVFTADDLKSGEARRVDVGGHRIAVVRIGDDWYAIGVSWLPGHEHWGWYVNLQRPLRRSAIGFETMDLALDVIIDADRSWRWKDEDELETFVARGVFEPDLPQRLRAEALGVVSRLERNEPPFSEPWPEWRPDPSWERPVLPSGWDRLQR
jgi:hypothetical protein